MRRALILSIVVMTASAAADPKKPDAPAAPAAWIGTFIPKDKTPCSAGCETAKPVARPGIVRVLTPSDGGAVATGLVMIVQPVIKAYGSGKVDKGVVTMVSFPYDENRDTDNNVLVLPPGSKAVLIQPTKADVVAIKATLLAKAEELANIRKSVATLEVVGVDTDGDGKADLAVTYGCNAWADGSCQSRGQFFLARRGLRWVVIE